MECESPLSLCPTAIGETGCCYIIMRCALFFLYLLLLFSTAYSAEPLRIIYLKGTCCAGKTTLIQAIREKEFDLEIIDEDSVAHRRYPQAVAQRFPSAYASLVKAIAEENLYHALRINDLLFKKGVVQEARIEAEQALRMIQDELNARDNLSWKRR